MTEHLVASGLMRDLVGFAEFIKGIETGIRRAWERAHEGHRRAAILRAYKLRHRWRRGDRHRLEELGVSQIGRAHFDRITAARRRGRPVVTPYLPLAAAVCTTLETLVALGDRNTAPHIRRRLLRATPFWPHVVEAVYRGEYAGALARGVVTPSTHAEEETGRACGLAGDSVRKLATGVRRSRRETGDPAWFPSISAAEFVRWTRTTEIPERLCVSRDETEAEGPPSQAALPWNTHSSPARE
ncbi:hypothetical protein ACE7GA_26730 (plasmid) [Roseomonas sp. CCTCC AB2023176]|uniref:hypothetical protein n=1 Tax=Roseomonas sp. CCTCC AB2023176 TaxID=3342640 RepID=UPI0035E1E46C